MYAKWKKTAGREYTITWKDWDGKMLADVKVEEGGLPDYPGASNPSRSGYIFTGWTPKIVKERLIYQDGNGRNTKYKKNSVKKQNARTKR